MARRHVVQPYPGTVARVLRRVCRALSTINEGGPDKYSTGTLLDRCSVRRYFPSGSQET
jgi:hypothetical protein